MRDANENNFNGNKSIVFTGFRSFFSLYRCVFERESDVKLILRLTLKLPSDKTTLKSGVNNFGSRKTAPIIKEKSN